MTLEQEKTDYAREAASNTKRHPEKPWRLPGQIPSLPRPSNPPTIETDLSHPITTEDKENLKHITITDDDTDIENTNVGSGQTHKTPTVEETYPPQEDRITLTTLKTDNTEKPFKKQPKQRKGINTGYL